MAGPFYFAWADFDDEFGEEHLLFELRIISFALSQSENEVATLEIIAQNPRIGLLNPGRKRYCYFSWDDGEGVVPLFYGRIVGIPSSIAANKVQLQFRAEPDDFQETKADFADTLKELPYYDPLWVDPSNIDDPDFVLTARSVHFHVDRVTHELTISDDFDGEDGILTFAATDVLRNSVDLQIGTPAVSQIDVTAEVRWNQQASGTIDLSSRLVTDFKAGEAGGTFPSSGGSNSIRTYSPDVLLDNWPLPGDDIGGGWSVEDSVVDIGTNRWISPQQYTQGMVSLYGSNALTDKAIQGISTLLGATVSPALVQDTVAFDFPLTTLKPTVVARYDAARERHEIVKFTIKADIQELVTDAGGADIKQLTLASNDASEPIDGSEEYPLPPIGDVRRRFYFTTDRGRLSFEHCVLRARAELLDSARAVNVTFETHFARILEVSTRMNATMVDPRLPGGTASGKIVAYSASLDGNAGRAICSITIGCSVGKGNIVTSAAGDPNYVEEDYVNVGYQTYSNKMILVAGDVAYSDYDQVASNDDGIDFFDFNENNAVNSVIITNGPGNQQAVLLAHKFIEDVSEAQNVAESIKSNICIDLKPVQGGPFTTEYVVTTSLLMAPKGIDLEAASTA